MSGMQICYWTIDCYLLVPFSERKGYKSVKKCLNVCLFVCPSQSETSFSIFRRFDVLIKLCYSLSMSRNSNLRSDFFWAFIGQKLDQSETSFSIFRLFGVRIKLYYISHFEKKFEENCYKKQSGCQKYDCWILIKQWYDVLCSC